MLTVPTSRSRRLASEPGTRLGCVCMPGIEFTVAGLVDGRCGQHWQFRCDHDFREIHEGREVEAHAYSGEASPLENLSTAGRAVLPGRRHQSSADLVGKHRPLEPPRRIRGLQRQFILTAMVGENPARVDPCQELIRSIGPNLIVALLMDGPKLSTRWPARYTTVSAEDPGCSVLIDAFLVGSDKRLTPILPPNRSCGFPEYGFPVGGFFIEAVSRFARLRVVRTDRQPDKATSRTHSSRHLLPGSSHRQLPPARESRWIPVMSTGMSIAGML